MATTMILDPGPTFEIIRVTAEFSNAVLVAVMPYISDVAQELDLPVPHPMTVEHVVRSSIIPEREWTIGVEIKGGWAFSFHRGYVDTIQGPHSYYALQDPDEIPRFYGPVNMSKAEAIQLGRDTLRKLGIPLESVFAEQEPRVTEPFKIETNTVPHYRIEWLNPTCAMATSVEVDVNGNTRKIERLALSNESLRKPLPKVSVIPERDTRFPLWPDTNPEYVWRLLPFVLRGVDDYALKLSLPIPRPLTTNHLARYRVDDNGGWPHAELELTNGWRFTYRGSIVSGYEAPDIFFACRKPFLIRDFAGKWNLTEDQCVQLVRRTLSKLGHPTNLVHFEVKPQVSKPAVPGIPRYQFYWYYIRNSEMESAIWAEVDADKGELKSLYFDNQVYWNHPPPIDVPIVLPVPREPNQTPAKDGSKPVGKETQGQPLAFPVPLQR